MTDIKKCTQTRCSFNEVNGGQIICPECSSCGAESNTIDEDCVNCWNCKSDEGYIRSGIPKALKEKIKLLEKKREELEISIMNKLE